MSEMKMNGARRAFFMRGGAVLGAGVATTAAAATFLPHSALSVADRTQQLQRELTNHQDREAIRELHLAFTRAIESRAYETAVELFEPHATLDLSGSGAVGRSAILRLFAIQYRQQLAAVIHSAYRHSPLRQQDSIAIAANGLHASGTFHCEVELSSPLPTDSTLAQMARLQGQVADRRWEAGCFDARYIKIEGRWKLAALRYSAV